MKNKLRLLKCENCGALVLSLNDCTCNNCGIKCCDKQMVEVTPNTVDASKEKHVPVYEKIDDEIVIKVGSIEHPMTKEHYIMWIVVIKDNKMQKIELYPEQDTSTRFQYIKGSTIYAYCNLHGLWSAEVE